MGFARRTLRFGGGLVLGAAVSTAVSVLLAPQSGPELQGAMIDRKAEAERAGEEAEILEAERLKREFRVAVNDPTALTGKFDRPGGAAATTPAAVKPVDDEMTKAGREAAKKQDEARKARERAAKERKEAEQAEQDAAKKQQAADEAQRKASHPTS